MYPIIPREESIIAEWIPFYRLSISRTSIFGLLSFPFIVIYGGLYGRGGMGNISCNKAHLTSTFTLTIKSFYRKLVSFYLNSQFKSNFYQNGTEIEFFKQKFVSFQSTFAADFQKCAGV